MKRIVFDARFYGEAGPGRYTKALVQHLEKVDTNNQYFILLTKLGFDEYQPKNGNFKKVLANYPWYGFAEQTVFLYKILSLKPDLYFVPHFNIPVLYPGKLVTAIPDMTMHKFSTKFSTTLPKWLFLLKKFVYKLVFFWAVIRSYKVIVPSNVVKDDFKSYLKLIPEIKYEVAYEGVDPDIFEKHPNPDDVLKKYNVSGNYLLYVGSMYEHKNVYGLLEMYKLLKSKYGYSGKFVLVGKKDNFSKEFLEKVKEEGLENEILLPAYRASAPDGIKMVVNDLEVTAFRQRADAYVFAAFTEGFSLTALESMVHDLPCIISDIACHREVYGDSAMYFDPYSVADMAKKVNEVLLSSSLREDLIQRGRKQVKLYDWLKTAQITYKVFMEVLNDTR